MSNTSSTNPQLAHLLAMRITSDLVSFNVAEAEFSSIKRTHIESLVRYTRIIYNTSYSLALACDDLTEEFVSNFDLTALDYSELSELPQQYSILAAIEDLLISITFTDDSASHKNLYYDNDLTADILRAVVAAAYRSQLTSAERACFTFIAETAQFLNDYDEQVCNFSRNSDSDKPYSNQAH